MRLAPVAVAAMTVVLLAGCSAAQPAPAPTPTKAPLVSALQECRFSGATPGVALGDDDASVVLDTKGTDDLEGLSGADLSCVLSALDTPDATFNLMNTTRALDGRQTATWGDYSAAWSFDPSTGLNVTVQTV